jgi:hypothetical protein
MTDLLGNILGAANGLGDREIVPNHITEDHLSLDILVLQLTA